jgi:uncharacterized membrane protein (UPF0127 family)
MASQPTMQRLIDRITGKELLAQVTVANRFWKRFLGLQFRKPLASGHGLLLEPCHSIHTCWMRFSIDAIFLDQDNRVLKVAEDVRPWKFLLPVAGARKVLETLPGATPLQSGDVVEFISFNS